MKPRLDAQPQQQSPDKGRVQPRTDLPPCQVPCRYFRSGFCARQGDCWYQHETEGLKIKKVTLKTIPKAMEATEEKPLLAKEAMVKGQGKEAILQWRKESWKVEVANAQALKRKSDAQKQGPSSKRSKVMHDLGNIQVKKEAKRGPKKCSIGEPARKVSRAKAERTVVLVRDEVEGMWTPIHLGGQPLT